MGLDLYSGPLWRFYSGNFERPSQRFGRETGLSVSVTYARGAEPMSRANAVLAAEELKRSLRDAAMSRLPSQPDIVSWDEDCPRYFSEQLRAEGWHSLLLMAAYNHRPDLMRPLALTSAIDSDPAFAEAFDRGYYLGPLAVLEAQMFVPSEENFLLMIEQAGRDPMFVTSTSNLAWMLAQMRDAVWGGAVDVETWFQRGLVPVDDHVMRREESGEFRRQPTEPVTDQVKHDAEYGFAVFSKALAFAEEYQTPIRHDS